MKTRLLTIESNLSETARKLNISKQAFYQMLEAADVKSGIIERLATLYNRPVGFFFDDCISNNSQAQIGGSHNNQAGNNISNNLSMVEHDELIRLRVENKFLKESITEKDERIAELKERIEELKAQLK